MSTSAVLKDNLSFKVLVKTAWLFAGLFVFCGCAENTINNSSASSIDAQFQIKSLQSVKPEAVASSSVQFYQNVLRVGLGSHCHYFPSDSTYAILLSKRCGPLKTTLKSFERFSREFDAAYLGVPVMSSFEGPYFKDIPDGCDWLD
ncbi:MAG: membrane protein insertion efficiency factor YidD [Pseudobdellovibrionaceae bacterium]